MSTIITDTDCIIDGQSAITLTAYICTDEAGHPVEINAETAEDAAQAYVDGGDWPAESKTYWISVNVREESDEDGDDEESIRVAIEPTEPECTEDAHEYHHPGEARSSYGGVVVEAVCVHCGLTRITDSGAQCMHTGRQGLDSTEYRTEPGF